MTFEINRIDRASLFAPSEAVLLPPEEIEETHPQQDQENLLPSPMSVFQEDRKKQHLASQALVTPGKQESNNGNNPFSSFFCWVLDVLFGADEPQKEFTLEEKEKILNLVEETKRALQAMTDVIDDEDKEKFEDLLIAIQKKRHLEQKRNVTLQGEALKKAKIAREEAQKEVNQKADEVLAQLSRKNFFETCQRFLTPVAGIISSFQLPVAWGAALFSLSALAAVNATLDQPLGEMASTLLDLAIYLPVMGAAAAGTPVFIMGGVLVGAQVLTTMGKAYADHTLRSYQGDLGVLNNEKRQATERFTSAGNKATKAADQYQREVGVFSDMMDGQRELIQEVFSR